MTKYYPGAGWWNLAFGNNKGPDIVGFVGPLNKLFIAEDFSDATEVPTMDGLWVNNGAAPAWNMDTENPVYVLGIWGTNQGNMNGLVYSNGGFAPGDWDRSNNISDQISDVMWSSKLGKFIAFAGRQGSAGPTNIWTSTNGQTWELNQGSFDAPWRL